MRQRVRGGILELTGLAPDGDDNALVFDPTRIIEGIEPSGDPVLLFRPVAYAESMQRRNA